MANHNFNFSGGEILRHIGASWFVSYCYCLNADPAHKNWGLLKTAPLRKKMYEKSRKYHKDWLKEILNMTDNKLLKNRIKLSASDIKAMANTLLGKNTLI